jgi:hypothetical protein
MVRDEATASRRDEILTISSRRPDLPKSGRRYRRRHAPFCLIRMPATVRLRARDADKAAAGMSPAG